METNLIQELRETAERYAKAADILAGKKKPSGSTSNSKRLMSASARARIAKAQKSRWAKWHKANKAA